MSRIWLKLAVNLARVLGCGAAAFFMLAIPSQGAEQVGETVAITPSVTGSGGPLAVSSPIYRNERIRSSPNGVEQFEFRDGTKLAIGPNSSIVIDRFVFDDSNKVKNLTLNVTRGTFRWISGKSNSSAYNIKLPTGTLGVRGTVFDVYVGPRATAVVLIKGQVQFCGNTGGCRQLTRGCDVVIANAAGVNDWAPTKGAKSVVDGVNNEQAFPFTTGNRKLSRSFGGGSCESIGLMKKTRRPERSGENRENNSKDSGDNSNGPD